MILRRKLYSTSSHWFLFHSQYLGRIKVLEIKKLVILSESFSDPDYHEDRQQHHDLQVILKT